MQRVVHTWTAIHRSGSVLSKAEQGPMPASPLYYSLFPPLLFRVSLLPPFASQLQPPPSLTSQLPHKDISNYFEIKTNVLPLLGSVAGLIIQTNGRLNFVDGLRLGGLVT